MGSLKKIRGWLLVSTFIFLTSITIVSGPIHEFIPIVFGQQFAVSTVCDASAPLLDQDTGGLSAILDTAGRFVIAYQDRAHNSQIHIVQHVGSGVVELPGVDSSKFGPLFSQPSPQFTLPGPKQGPPFLVPLGGGKSRVYYTQRKIGDDTGPYGIWCYEF